MRNAYPAGSDLIKTDPTFQYGFYPFSLNKECRFPEKNYRNLILLTKFHLCPAGL